MFYCLEEQEESIPEPVYQDLTAVLQAEVFRLQDAGAGQPGQRDLRQAAKSVHKKIVPILQSFNPNPPDPLPLLLPPDLFAIPFSTV